MSLHADNICIQLSRGPMSAAKLLENLGISQPTMSRALTELDNKIVRFGAARSIHYTLRDTTPRVPDMPIYRINAPAYDMTPQWVSPLAMVAGLMIPYPKHRFTPVYLTQLGVSQTLWRVIF